MKKFVLPFVVLVLTAMAACNNNGDKKNATESTGKKKVPQTAADSLMADVMDGHDEGMAKMGKLSTMQKEVQRVLDSIATLPAKAKQAAAPYAAKLSTLITELKSSQADMEIWMDEFNMDSAVNNTEQRIKYLAEEKLKISRVKESILGSLQKADSLLKAKF